MRAGIKAFLLEWITILDDRLDFLNSAIFFKIDEHAWKLKTHVTGALANFRTKAAAYIDFCQWPHDSNLTINILYIKSFADVSNDNGKHVISRYITVFIF